MCTNTTDGFNNDSYPYITWYNPTNNVRTVELVFRDRQHAHIADLKVFYEPDLYIGWINACNIGAWYICLNYRFYEPYNTNNIVTEGLLVEQQFTNSYMKKG